MQRCVMSVCVCVCWRACVVTVIQPLSSGEVRKSQRKLTVCSPNISPVYCNLFYYEIL